MGSETPEIEIRSREEVKRARPVIPLSVRIPHDLHERLREIAHRRYASINRLLLDGAKLIVAQYPDQKSKSPKPPRD